MEIISCNMLFILTVGACAQYTALLLVLSYCDEIRLQSHAETFFVYGGDSRDFDDKN